VLGDELALLLIVPLILLNFSVGGRVVKLSSGLHKRVKQAAWSIKQFIEPDWHRVSGDIGWVIGIKIERGHIFWLSNRLPCPEWHLSTPQQLEPGGNDKLP
jgi:hypothetical protein